MGLWVFIRLETVRNIGKKKDRGMVMSAMSIDKGLKKGNETILVAVVKFKSDVTVDVPNFVAELLKKFTDVMPPELPKTLPPRRDINNRIELLPGTVAPAEAPYRTTPKELAELQKYLHELLDVSLIILSIVPYGAPFLFQKKQDGTMRLCVD